MYIHNEKKWKSKRNISFWFDSAILLSLEKIIIEREQMEKYHKKRVAKKKIV